MQFDGIHWRAALAASTLTAVAYARRSLTPTACIAAWPVGYAAASAGSVPFAALLTFFVSSTVATKIGKRRKAKVDAHYHPAGNRDHWQVAANGFAATALLCAHPLGLMPVWVSRTAAVYAVVAHYAACQGDTWSSEIGILSAGQPRLLVGFRQVPRGTNGGVSLLGLVAATVGGGLVGGGCAFANYVAPSPGLDPQTLCVVGIAAGLVGSLVDSLLGQFLQYSGVDRATGGAANAPGPSVVHTCGVDILSNNAVNFLSAVAVTAGSLWWAGGRGL